MHDLSLPPISETFDRFGVDGKQLLLALDEYLELTYELRYQIDPLRDPFFFLQECDKIRVIEAFHDFARRNDSLLACYKFDLPEDDDADAEQEESDDEDE